MTPLPRVAIPVVEVIRRRAFKPASPPTMVIGGLRWLVFKRHGWCCPLGLIEGVPYVVPDIETAASRLKLSPTRCKRFIQWWDSLLEKDAVEAFAVLWPEAKP
jgi:hypothetical protein